MGLVVNLLDTYIHEEITTKLAWSQTNVDMRGDRYALGHGGRPKVLLTDAVRVRDVELSIRGGRYVSNETIPGPSDELSNH